MPFSHPNFPGMALVIDGPATYQTEILIDEYTDVDEFGDEVPYYEYGWETVESETDVMVHMVGDDRPYQVARDDLTEIHSEDYCGGCGQIGCKAYG